MIKKYQSFIESISGTELVGKHMGPNYPENELPSTIKSKDTEVIYSDVYGKIVSQNEYGDLYNDYLKKGGSPLQGFNLENLDIVLSKLNEFN